MTRLETKDRYSLVDRSWVHKFQELVKKAIAFPADLVVFQERVKEPKERMAMAMTS